MGRMLLHTAVVLGFCVLGIQLDRTLVAPLPTEWRWGLRVMMTLLALGLTQLPGRRASGFEDLVAHAVRRGITRTLHANEERRWLAAADLFILHRRRRLHVTAVLAIAAASLALAVPVLRGAAPQISGAAAVLVALAWLDHAVLRARVAAGVYGANQAEAREFLAFLLSPERRRDGDGGSGPRRALRDVRNPGLEIDVGMLPGSPEVAR